MKPLVRFRELLPHVVIDVGGCWNWTAGRNPGGYANVQRHREGKHYNLRGHRVTYEMIRGPVPDGLELDHLCRNRRCVNPWHLEAVTRRENLMRSPVTIFAQRREATHCKHDHEFSEENTYIAKTGQRVCRACRRESQAKYRARVGV